jgi:hypothetical protein
MATAKKNRVRPVRDKSSVPETSAAGDPNPEAMGSLGTALQKAWMAPRPAESTSDVENHQDDEPEFLHPLNEKPESEWTKDDWQAVATHAMGEVQRLTQSNVACIRSLAAAVTLSQKLSEAHERLKIELKINAATKVRLPRGVTAISLDQMSLADVVFHLKAKKHSVRRRGRPPKYTAESFELVRSFDRLRVARGGDKHTELHELRQFADIDLTHLSPIDREKWVKTYQQFIFNVRKKMKGETR